MMVKSDVSNTRPASSKTIRNCPGVPKPWTKMTYSISVAIKFPCKIIDGLTSIKHHQCFNMLTFRKSRHRKFWRKSKCSLMTWKKVLRTFLPISHLFRQWTGKSCKTFLLRRCVKQAQSPLRLSIYISGRKLLNLVHYLYNATVFIDSTHIGCITFWRLSYNYSYYFHKFH